MCELLHKDMGCDSAPELSLPALLAARIWNPPSCKEQLGANRTQALHTHVRSACLFWPAQFAYSHTHPQTAAAANLYFSTWQGQ